MRKRFFYLYRRNNALYGTTSPITEDGYELVDKDETGEGFASLNIPYRTGAFDRAIRFGRPRPTIKVKAGRVFFQKNVDRLFFTC